MLVVGYLVRRPQAAAPADDPAVISRAPTVDFDGEKAFAHIQRLVDIGPRSCGSAGHDRALAYILSTLKGYGLAPQREDFVARTPDGPMPMTDVVVTIGAPLTPVRGTPAPANAPSRFPGARPIEPMASEQDTVVLAAHYDTKRFPFRFVGANDGGSGTAALLEMARVLVARPASRRVVLVFFDGEEAFHEWSDTDSTYGSRHLAARWDSQHILPRIRAFILMDMIGFRELRFMRDYNSSRWLQNRIWQQAAEQNRGAYFSDESMSIEDDHIPFVRRGVPAAVLIDFQYGPNGSNAYWHTPQDTLDKISSRSLQIVGRIIEGTIREL